MASLQLKFILDAHLGKLARYLRLLGFDVLFDGHYEDKNIIQIANHEKRIVLSRDRGLINDTSLKHGYFVDAIKPLEQLHEIIKHFDLTKQFTPFTRCLECNGKIIAVDKKTINNLPKNTDLYYQEFYQCANCNKIYWHGSHYKKMKIFIERLREA